MENAEKKDAGISYVSIVLVILISSIFPIIMFQLLEKNEPLQDSPRTYGTLFEVDKINENAISVRNTGLNTIEDIRFYIENTEIKYAGPETIIPGNVEEFYLDKEQVRKFYYPNTLKIAVSGLTKFAGIDFSGL